MTQLIQEQTFHDIPLSPQLARAVADMNYSRTTSIQGATIPILLEGQDVIGRSSTGTGKTAAFGIPAVELADGGLKKAQILVLSPTRELAMQIAREMQKYAKYKEGISVAAVYGGASMGDQIRQLKQANIVIGTPGRLMDHLRRRTLIMDNVKMVVLDEADEMLSMGFIEDIQTILSQAPVQRQTALFSATMPPPILKISQTFLSNPQVIDVISGRKSQADIEQTYYTVPQHKKQDALALLLQYADANRTMVFCNTKTMVDELAAELQKQGFSSAGLHGDMTQAVRTQVMQRFRDGLINILVATDVAARGIDVDDVELVINFDLPQSFEYYVHRIGRTGRAGKRGLSQTLICSGKQMSVLKSLMRFTGSDIHERRMPAGTDLMERAVSKAVAELQPQMQESRGKAAQMLVSRLMDTDEAGMTAEQAACILAEKLLGGDEKYANPGGFEETFSRKKSSGNTARNTRNHSQMVTLIANIGRNARVTPSHLIGTIADLLDVSGKTIGKIEIRDEMTLISMQEEVAYALIRHTKPVRIKGIKVSFVMQKKRTSSYSVSSPVKRRTKTVSKASKVLRETMEYSC